MLNCLKFNVMAMTTFAYTAQGVLSIPNLIFSGCLLVSLIFLPFFFARTIKKKRPKLLEEKTKSKCGTLYKGLNIGFYGYE